MKKATIIMLLAAAMLPALGHAQTVNICDRTPQVRDRIMWAVGANDCAAVDSESLAGVTSLGIEKRQGLTSLRAGDFDGLTSLQTLSLDSNQLAALPEGIFDGLTSLQTLSLGGNHLVGLTANDPLFAGLPSEVDLWLGGQTPAISVCDRTPQVRDAIMAAVNAEDCAPVGAARVTRLEIWGQGLTSLHAGDFDGLTNLRELDLSFNHLVGLTANDPLFAGLPSEVELQLGGQTPAISVCDRTPQVRDAIMAAVNAEDCAAVGAARITRLDIWGQGLTSLQAGDFNGLTSLRELDLRNNHLVGLTANDPLFAGLPSEVELRLGGQKTPAISVCDRTPQVRDAIMAAANTEDCAAVDADGIRAIRIDRQGLTSLQAGDFDGLTKLKKWLYLQENQLTGLPEGVFDGLTNLQWLHLSDNQLTWLPEGVFDGLTNLQRLHLSDNQLAGLPEGVFDGLTNLQILHLDNNQLTVLPEGLFDGLTNLQEIWLGYNQLAGLPEGLFDGLTSLRYIGLGDQLTRLPEGLFDGLTNLRKLDLTGNKLTSLPPGLFDGLTNLKWLHLGWNRLTSLTPGLFAGLTNLESLILKRNGLTSLPPGLFAGLTDLDILCLGGNDFGELTREDPLFADLPEGVSMRC